MSRLPTPPPDDPNELLGLKLRGIGPILRRTMYEHGARRDTCIAATRLGISVLARGGYHAYALSVYCDIFNAPYVEQIKLKGGLPDDVAERERWHDQFNAHSIGLGRVHANEPLKPNRWPGHLVAIVERKFLWDLSIDQAERPQYDIAFPAPVIVPLWLADDGAEPFLRGRTPLIGNFNGSMLRYEARPADKSFRVSPQWDASHPMQLEMLAALGMEIPHER